MLDNLKRGYDIESTHWNLQEARALLPSFPQNTRDMRVSGATVHLQVGSVCEFVFVSVLVCESV